MLKKIHILFQITEQATGGGNQFLRALRDFFIEKGQWVEDPSQADVILMSSYHEILKAIKLKIRYPQKKFVHRLGPIFHLHRKKSGALTDAMIIRVANKLADTIIFQSAWTQAQCMDLGLHNDKPSAIIGNAPDEKLFNTQGKSLFNPARIRLVAASWSVNENKGFSFYQYLDKHLDTRRYEMDFIGNTPLSFEHIKTRPPLTSPELAQEIKQHDIFISAIKDDACSNTLSEALACGLPVVALKSGGNQEIVKKGGEAFETDAELMEKIDQVAAHYTAYKHQIDVLSIKEIGELYAREIENMSERAGFSFGQRMSTVLLYMRTAIELFILKLLER